MSDKEQTPDKKEYSLKKAETIMLQIMVQNHQTIVSNFLNFIAIERWAYPADRLTSYELHDGMTKVHVWQRELTPEEQKANSQPSPVEKNTTADAIKKGD